MGRIRAISFLFGPILDKAHFNLSNFRRLFVNQGRSPMN